MKKYKVFRVWYYLEFELFANFKSFVFYFEYENIKPSLGRLNS